MRFNIIGAGRLGKNLAASLMKDGHHQLIAICNHYLPSALNAVTELGQGQAVAKLSLLPEADLTFITAPDDSIALIAEELAKNPCIAPGQIVAHCSGLLSSDVLLPLLTKGCAIASIHPLKAFRLNFITSDSFNACYCVIEGTEEASHALTDLFTQIGAHVLPIKADQKTVYHAAAVIASNYVVTLAGIARTLFSEAGLTDLQAQHITHHLMKNSLANLNQTKQASEALTGPLLRGDLDTIQQHLHALTDSEVNALYRSAALATLRFTPLEPEKKASVIKRLGTENV